jgi:hypothetical protein
VTTTSTTTERIQLHSALGRLLYLFASLFFIDSLVSIAAVACLSYQQGKLNPGIALLALLSIPKFFISSWAWKHRGCVWATSAGLELGTPSQHIPWAHVMKVKRVPLLSGMQPFYLIKLEHHRIPFGFHACDDVERVIARFKS